MECISAVCHFEFAILNLRSAFLPLAPAFESRIPISPVGKLIHPKT